MVDNPLKKIFLAFLSELDKEIKEKHPELSEDQRRIYADYLLNKLLLNPVGSVGSVSELRDNLPFVHNA